VPPLFSSNVGFRGMKLPVFFWLETS